MTARGPGPFLLPEEEGRVLTRATVSLVHRSVRESEVSSSISGGDADYHAATSSMSVGSSSPLPVLLTRLDTGHMRTRSSAAGLRSLAGADKDRASDSSSIHSPLTQSASPPAMISSFACVVLRVPSPTQARTLGRAYRNPGRARSTWSGGGSNPPSGR